MTASPFDRMTRRCVRRFGIDTVYLRGNEETPVKGVFDKDYFAVATDGDAVINSREIKVHYHAADLPRNPRKGDRIRINGLLYNISDPQPDSEYGITLVLKVAE